MFNRRHCVVRSVLSPKTRRQCRETGFVLVAALMFLVILSIIGVSATSTMQIEQIVSSNDRLAQENFYGADGGSEMAVEIIEQNVACRDEGGFRITDTINNTTRIKGVEVLSPNLYENKSLEESLPANVSEKTWLKDYPSDVDTPADKHRDITFPPRTNGVSPQQHTNIFLFSRQDRLEGAGLEFGAGTEGRGKGDAQGAFYYEYDIHSRQYGSDNSQAIVRVGYRHVVGMGGECKYGQRR